MNLAFEPLLLLLTLTSPTATLASGAGAPIAMPRHTAGLYAWIDPATGKLGAPDDQAAARMQLELGLPDWSVEQALRTDSADLVVEEDAFGGLSVDLQGRFQSAIYGRVDDDGQTTIEHQAPTTGVHP